MTESEAILSSANFRTRVRALPPPSPEPSPPFTCRAPPPPRPRPSPLPHGSPRRTHPPPVLGFGLPAIPATSSPFRFASAPTRTSSTSRVLHPPLPRVTSLVDAKKSPRKNRRLCVLSAGARSSFLELVRHVTELVSYRTATRGVRRRPRLAPAPPRHRASPRGPDRETTRNPKPPPPPHCRRAATPRRAMIRRNLHPSNGNSRGFPSFLATFLTLPRTPTPIDAGMAIGTILDNIRFPSFANDKMTPKEGAFAATPRPDTGGKRHVSHLSASCLNHRTLPPSATQLAGSPSAPPPPSPPPPPPPPRLPTRAGSPTTSTTTAAPDLRWSVFGGVFGLISSLSSLVPLGRR